MMPFFSFLRFKIGWQVMASDRDTGRFARKHIAAVRDIYARMHAQSPALDLVYCVEDTPAVAESVTALTVTSQLQEARFILGWLLKFGC